MLTLDLCENQVFNISKYFDSGCIWVVSLQENSIVFISFCICQMSIKGHVLLF